MEPIILNGLPISNEVLGNRDLKIKDDVLNVKGYVSTKLESPKANISIRNEGMKAQWMGAKKGVSRRYNANSSVCPNAIPTTRNVSKCAFSGVKRIERSFETMQEIQIGTKVRMTSSVSMILQSQIQFLKSERFQSFRKIGLKRNSK